MHDACSRPDKERLSIFQASRVAMVEGTHCLSFQHVVATLPLRAPFPINFPPVVATPTNQELVENTQFVLGLRKWWKYYNFLLILEFA